VLPAPDHARRRAAAAQRGDAGLQQLRGAAAQALQRELTRGGGESHLTPLLRGALGAMGAPRKRHERDSEEEGDE